MGGHSEEQLEIGKNVLRELGDFDLIEEERMLWHDSEDPTELDVIGYEESDEIYFLEIKPSFHNLNVGFNQLERGMRYLREQGYKADGKILVLKDNLMSFRDAVENLPPLYSKSTLYHEWGEDESNVLGAMEVQFLMI